MTRITHALVGLAAASFFPCAFRNAADGNPTGFIAGLVGGLLPSLLDGFLSRYRVRDDVSVVPDPLTVTEGGFSHTTLQMIAGAVAASIGAAMASGRTVRLRLYPARQRCGRIRPYEVYHDVAGRRIMVMDPSSGRCAMAGVPCDLQLDHLSRITVSGLSIVYAMTPVGLRIVRPIFEPQRRRWTHSVFAAVCWTGLTGVLLGPSAGLIGGCAYGAHLVADRMSFLGCGLWAPFSNGRVPGKGFIRTRANWWDCGVSWAALWILCLNIALNAPGSSPVPVRLFIVVGAAPVAVMMGCTRAFDRRRKEQRSQKTPAGGV